MTNPRQEMLRSQWQSRRPTQNAAKKARCHARGGQLEAVHVSTGTPREATRGNNGEQCFQAKVHPCAKSISRLTTLKD